ncbi:MAG: heme exporter protein CcmB [Ilumatobacteraceae bacterium]|nr:heme exporter protein CcmB [Ilumatobacteraceae bacterium]
MSDTYTATPSLLKVARTIMIKDLRTEVNSRVILNQVAPFSVVIMILFAFALDNDGILQRVAPGLVWLATMFSMLVVVQRTFAVETADGALDALRVAGVDTRALFLGKSVALGVQLCALDVVLVATAFFLYNVQLELSGLLVVFVTVLLACIGLGFIGTLYGGLAAGARGRETLLPLLLLPVVAPVLIGATRATEAGFNSGGAEVSEGWPWSGLLLIFAVIFGVVGSVAFGPLIDE